MLFRQRDLYRPLRVHRLAMSVSRPRSELFAGSGLRPRPDVGSGSAGKPSTPRRPVTPSDKPDKSFSAQTRTGRSLSSLTSTSVANVPVPSDVVARRSRAVTTSSPSAALRDAGKPAAAAAAVRDSSQAESTTRTMGKLSRTLVKSLSADKAKPTVKTSDEQQAVTAREPSVSKSKSTTNVKKQAKSRTEAVDKEVSKDMKVSTSAKVPLRLLFTLIIKLVSFSRNWICFIRNLVEFIVSHMTLSSCGLYTYGTS